MSKRSARSNEVWVGDTICMILTEIYVHDRARFEVEAARMGISVEQLAAASIMGLLYETVERAKAVGARGSGR